MKDDSQIKVSRHYISWLTWTTKDDSQIKGSRPHYISWLKDLLPKNFPNARIMPFRQNTSYLVNAPRKSIEECGQQLLDEMLRIRRTQEVLLRSTCH